MKASGIISAILLAHAAFAQVSDSSSSTVSSTGVAPAAVSASSLSSSGTTSSYESTRTHTGTKAAATGKSSSSSASAASAPPPSYTPAGSSTPISETQTSSSGNPLIPSSVSDGCNSFLTALNTDATISSCFTPLLNALSSFNSNGASASASTVTKTLNTLCSSNACSSSTMRTKLTEFKDACGDELTGANPNTVVIKEYDVFYSLTPFKSAICARDANTQAYCLLNTSSSSSNTTQSVSSRGLSNALVSSPSRRKRAQTVLVPNTDTYRSTNLMYLFTSPDMNAGQLCVSCTQQIVSKYIAFESSTPYALGIKNSPLLGGQGDLWTAMQEKCPASFMTEVSNIAGVASADSINGVSPVLGAGSLFTAFASALAATLALA